MLKKLLILLAALLLPLAAACAGDAFPAVYQLCDYTENDGVFVLGTGVLYGDQTTLLSTITAATATTGNLWAVGEGGAYKIARGVGFRDKGELALLTLERPSPATPLTLAPQGAETERLVAMNRDGAVMMTYPAIISSLTLKEGPCVLYEADQHLLPGGVLLDEEDRITGLGLYTYAEGTGRYVAVTAEGLRAALPSEASPMADATALWLDGFTMTCAEGVVTVDWSDVNLDVMPDGWKLFIYYADEANPFYSYIPCVGSHTQQELLLVPGRTYRVGMAAAARQEDVDWLKADTQLITLPAAQPITLCGYEESEWYLGAMPAAWADEPFTPVNRLEEISAATLTRPDQALFWQSVSSYGTDSPVERFMVVALETPEGYCTIAPGGFIFDPSMQKSDVWHMDITGAFELYLEFSRNGVYAPGEYRLSLYIGGEYCNSITWNLD